MNNERLVFRVIRDIGSRTFGYEDDYSEVRALERAKAYIKKTGFNRKIVDSVEESTGLSRGISIVCNSTDDIQECAGDVMKLIRYLMEDHFYEKNYSRIGIICEGGEGEEPERIELFFGNVPSPWGYLVDADTDEAAIGEWLASAYEKQTKETELMDPSAEDGGMKIQEEEDSGEWEAPFRDENSFLTPEGAYEKLYKEVFEPNGDKYECTYNAKGNFYGILGEKTGEKNGGELTARRTVVYDRISANGKCHLFVAYKEYYDNNGNEWETEILNFYAVNRETGEVAAGNKTAWEETASKEYQEATGDK